MPAQSLVARLREVEHDLMQVARRQYALEAFVKELDGATRLKRFRIWNDVLWMTVLDSRDMLVIHLASWVKGVCGRRGLTRQLKAQHLQELPAVIRATERAEEDAYFAGLLDHEHAAAFKRLFPGAMETHATSADLDALTKRLKRTADPLLKDRNDNRAHAFENRAHAFEPGGQGSAKMLDLTELRDSLTHFEQFLNDLHLVSHCSTVTHHDMNDANCKVVAEEMVESILIGSSSRREILMDGRDRETFYKALHDLHDALPSGSQVLFNDNY